MKSKRKKRKNQEESKRKEVRETKLTTTVKERNGKIDTKGEQNKQDEKEMEK